MHGIFILDSFAASHLHAITGVKQSDPKDNRFVGRNSQGVPSPDATKRLPAGTAAVTHFRRYYQNNVNSLGKAVPCHSNNVATHPF